MSAPEPAAGRCVAEGHCITCSDEGVPMRVVAPGSGEDLALCQDAEGQVSEVMTALVGAVAAGDALLVHAGTALLRLDPPAPPQGEPT
jgi:hydrogenase maturation factor